MSEPLKIDYDANKDVLTIDGFRYAGVMFREHLHKPTPEGQWLRIVSTDDGAVTVETTTDLIRAPSPELVARLRETVALIKKHSPDFDTADDRLLIDLLEHYDGGDNG